MNVYPIRLLLRKEGEAQEAYYPLTLGYAPPTTLVEWTPENRFDLGRAARLEWTTCCGGRMQATFDGPLEFVETVYDGFFNVMPTRAALSIQTCL